MTLGRAGDSDATTDVVARTAAAMSADVVAISRDVTRAIEREIPALRGDQSVVRMLGASVTANVSTFLHVLENGIDCAEIAAPLSAIEYARRLAQRDTPVAELVRAYRVGQARFLRLMLDELLRQAGGSQLEGAATIRAVEQNTSYIDRIVGHILDAYEHERSSWSQHRSAALMSRVREVVGDERIDVDQAEGWLDYPLRQAHVGLVMWCDRDPTEANPLHTMARVAENLADAFGAKDSPLFVPRDETTAWVWIPTASGRSGPDLAVVTETIKQAPLNASIAVGSSADGVDGFRRTHHQALSAWTVAEAAGAEAARITRFIDVAPIALMCADLNSLRAWVAETLGPLAIASSRNDGLRSTVSVFLRTGGSYAATADRLHFHRNTVKYRIHQAEELRGRPLDDGRLDVELALLACEWLGTSVLRPL